MIRAHKQFNNKIVFAGGAWKWNGFAPHGAFGIKTIEKGLASCLENGIENVFITMWGDNGAECPIAAILPQLCFAAETAYGYKPKKAGNIGPALLALTGVPVDKFMTVDLPNALIKETAAQIINPCKYLLYNDCLTGLFDSTLQGNEAAVYKKYAGMLKRAGQIGGDYTYIFETSSALCDALSIKAGLGSRTRALYRGGDRAGLKVLAQKDYTAAIKKINLFYEKFKTQWMTENKPHGFDVQDLRIGGLLLRLDSVKKRLIDFADGKIAAIPELDEEQLDFVTGGREFGKRPIQHNRWDSNSTANVM
jgi:hypothetical protein